MHRRAVGAVVVGVVGTLVVGGLRVSGVGVPFLPVRDGTASSTAGAAAIRLASIAGMQSRSMTVGGERRHYLLYVPPSVQRRSVPAPLVLSFHGLHLSSTWMVSSTGLVQAADRSGVVLALPDAVHGAWNDGRLGRHGPDDVGFATTLVHSLVTAGVADPRRVTVSGYSNGAELAMVLAARNPGTFAALVSVSGELPGLPGTPRPHSPVPAYLVHGSADPVQPWAGRPTRNRLHPALLSVDATVAAFVAANRTTGDGERVPTGGTAVQEFVWRAGAGGAPVVLYRLIGAGHGWPNRPGPSRAVLSGGRLDAAALVMQVAVGTGGAGGASAT